MPLDSILYPAKKQNHAIHFVELWTTHGSTNETSARAIIWSMASLAVLTMRKVGMKKAGKFPAFFDSPRTGYARTTRALGLPSRGSLLCFSGVLQASGFRKISGECRRADFYAFLSLPGDNLRQLEAALFHPLQSWSQCEDGLLNAQLSVP